MVRGWTPGMTPRYDSILQQKIFRHDIGVRASSKGKGVEIVEKTLHVILIVLIVENQLVTWLLNHFFNRKKMDVTGISSNYAQIIRFLYVIIE